MRAGTLNRQIALERRVETPSGTGGSTITWTPIATVWANVKYLNGAETIRADFPVSVAKASIRIRWRTDIDATCRAVYTEGANTTYFEIKTVLPDMVGRESVDLVCHVGENLG